jgi:hypothetical protein
VGQLAELLELVGDSVVMRMRPAGCKQGGGQKAGAENRIEHGIFPFLILARTGLPGRGGGMFRLVEFSLLPGSAVVGLSVHPL